MADEIKDQFNEADDSQKEFTSNFKESIDILRDAIISLGDKLNEALKEGIRNTEGLDSATKRVANKYRRELESSVDKVIIGTDTLKDLQNKINNGLDISKDISKEINSLEKEKEKILSRVESLKRQGIDLEEETQILLKYHIQDQEDILKNLKKENKNREDALGLIGKLAEGGEHVIEHIDKSGKWNKALGLDDAIHKTRHFATQLTQSGKQAAGLGGKFQIMGNLVGNIGKNLLKGFGPLAILLEIVHEVIHMDKVVGETAKKLGISYEHAFKIKGEMAKISNNSMDVFATSTNILEAYMNINEALGTRISLSKEELLTYNELTKRAGYSNEAALEMVKLGALTNKSSKELSKEFLGHAKLTAGQNKLILNEKQLLEGVSKISAAIKLSMGGSTSKIAEAVVKAKALGVEFSKLEGIQQSLLDFESSISAEIEAELFTGKQINLERARYAALTNDIATLSEELAKNFGTAEEFGRMGYFTQQKMAAAVGMTREELSQSLIEREALQNLSAKEGESIQQAYQRQLASLMLGDKKLTLEEARLELAKKLGNQQYADQLNSVSMQEEFNQTIEKLKEIFVSLAKPILAIVKPLVDVLSPVLSGIAFIVQKSLEPALNSIQVIFEAIGEILSPIKDMWEEIMKELGFSSDEGDKFWKTLMGIQKTIVQGILKPIIEVGKAIIKGIMTPLKGVAGVIGGIMKIFKGDFEEGFRQITKGIITVISSPFQLLLDLALGTINGIIKGINLIPGVDINKIPIPDIADMNMKVIPKMDDGIIPPIGQQQNYSRILSGPEGSVKINDKDTIVTGTNLNQNNSNNELTEVKNILLKILNKSQDIYLDGNKVGYALSTGKANFYT